MQNLYTFEIIQTMLSNGYFSFKCLQNFTREPLKKTANIQAWEQNFNIF